MKDGTIQKALAFLFGGTALKGIGGGLLSLLGINAGKKALGATAGTAALGLGAKTLGKRAVGAIPYVGWAILIGTTLVDIFGVLKDWFNKDTQDDNEPVYDAPGPWSYQRVNSNMVNNFYNNPAPQQAVANEITAFANFYLRNAKK